MLLFSSSQAWKKCTSRVDSNDPKHEKGKNHDGIQQPNDLNFLAIASNKFLDITINHIFRLFYNLPGQSKGSESNMDQPSFRAYCER